MCTVIIQDKQDGLNGVFPPNIVEKACETMFLAVFFEFDQALTTQSVKPEDVQLDPGRVLNYSWFA